MKHLPQTASLFDSHHAARPRQQINPCSTRGVFVNTLLLPAAVNHQQETCSGSLVLLFAGMSSRGDVTGATVSSSAVIDNGPASSLTSYSSQTNNRSLWNIIWSCLVMIFACTWAAVHPNIHVTYCEKPDQGRVRQWIWDEPCRFVSERWVLIVTSFLVLLHGQYDSILLLKK